ncbi:MAG TPA: hypothetical protein VJY35_14105 [Candidatus Eisenbacteria bacterium]|nr:hypothetical protein [Candidatus Eisenbacteria bacterium]
MLQARIAAAYRRHFRDQLRERMFLSSLAFFVTFGVTRLITFAARENILQHPVISYRGAHVHHLVPGILLLLGVGWGWLLTAGVHGRQTSHAMARMLSLVYGVGAALTLDEFALWLNLEDVYWEEQGRASLDAVAMFGGIISIGLWGGPFLRAVGRQFARFGRRRAPGA